MSATKNRHRCIRTVTEEMENYTYPRYVNHTPTGQCCGSMTFWCGSGYMFLTNRSGSCYFRHWPSRRQQKTNLNKFSAYYFLKVHLHHFSKIKVPKKSQNSRNQNFPYYFCLMPEGSGSGSIPLTNGSGSGSRRPKNIRIRIRNTATGHPRHDVPTNYLHPK